MAAFGIPGGMEIWVILGIALLIFGPTQLPKLAKMFGKTAKSLKDGIDGKLEDEDDKSAKPSESEKKDTAEKKDAEEKDSEA